MRRRNNQKGLQSVGEILQTALKKRGMVVKLQDNEVLKFWPQAVGQQIKMQTKIECLRSGTLFVQATSSVWVQQLHFMKKDILQKLNHLVGKDIIKEIRFSVGCDISPEKKEKEEESKQRSFLRERDKKMIRECTVPLRDIELAAILKRVMQKEINRRRVIQRRQDR